MNPINTRAQTAMERSGLAGCASTPVEPPMRDVREQLECLSKATCILEESIEMLARRLEPVRLAVPSAAADKDNAPIGSPVAIELRLLTKRVAFATSLIRQLECETQL